MKVLCYVQPHRRGGVARHSIEMINGLGRHSDLNCTLLTSKPDARRHSHFIQHFNTLPIQQHELPGKWIERSWKVAQWPPLRNRCRGFDLIYCPAEVRFPACGIPSIVTIHDVQALEQDLPWSATSAHQRFRSKWLRWLPKLLHEATCIATVSQFTRQRLIQLLGADSARIAVVGNGVSQAFFSHQPPRNALPQHTVVVIGGLRVKKGAEATLAVAAELRRRRSPLVIDIYGQHDPELVDLVAAHPNVRLHGYVGDESLAEQLSRSTALLFLSPYEGFGIPAVEAMAAGTPAVVSHAASLPEVVGDAGLIVDPSDPTSIADVVERLGSDWALREAVIARGRRRAMMFTWNACVDRLAAAMRQATSADASADRGTNEHP